MFKNPDTETLRAALAPAAPPRHLQPIRRGAAPGPGKQGHDRPQLKRPARPGANHQQRRQHPSGHARGVMRFSRRHTLQNSRQLN